MSLAEDFAPVHDAHVRLSVLRLLDAQPSYCANDSVLYQAVNALGLSCTRDQMRNHLGWLAEQRALTKVEHGVGVIVATLTERGSDLANGRSEIPGVQRPSPRG